MNELIIPDWPAPDNIRAITTTRIGGISKPPYASFNLATHVEDDIYHVAYNRTQLFQQLKLPNAPAWIEQVHGTTIINAAEKFSQPPQADASFSEQANVVCAVMTADCLPVLLCDKQGKYIAAIHAGWRSLVAGIIEATRDHLQSEDIIAWLGPAISGKQYEVGDEVRQQFIAADKEAEIAFNKNTKDKWCLDMYAVAKQRLARAGIQQVYGGDFCTYEDDTRFYSYRRDGNTGRMASLIWYIS